MRRSYQEEQAEDKPAILGKRAVGKDQQGKAAAQHERPGQAANVLNWFLRQDFILFIQ